MSVGAISNIARWVLNIAQCDSSCKDTELAVINPGELSDELVRYVAQAVMIFWGRAIFHKTLMNPVFHTGPRMDALDSLQADLVNAVKDKNLDLEMQLKKRGNLRF